MHEQAQKGIPPQPRRDRLRIPCWNRKCDNQGEEEGSKTLKMNLPQGLILLSGFP